MQWHQNLNKNSGLLLSFGISSPTNFFNSALTPKIWTQCRGSFYDLEICMLPCLLECMHACTHARLHAWEVIVFIWRKNANNAFYIHHAYTHTWETYTMPIDKAPYLKEGRSLFFSAGISRALSLRLPVKCRLEGPLPSTIWVENSAKNPTFFDPDRWRERALNFGLDPGTPFRN